MTENKIINRVSFVTLLGNILLTVFKFFAGVAGTSGAMVSDAVHSLSDIFTTVVAWAGVRFSGKKEDKDHPYGHERVECVASMLLGLVLAATAIGIGAAGVKIILGGNYSELQKPGAVALVAAVVSIAAKEAMYWYTRHYAKVLNSTAFLADAWHHRSDALSSVGSLIGIGGAMLGVPVLDPIASVVICLCILKVAYDVLRDALIKMLDTSCSDEYEAELREFIEGHDGVERLDVLRTRLFGNRVFIDAEIAVNAELSLRQAHDISETVHDSVEKRFENIKHIMIHVNPAE